MAEGPSPEDWNELRKVWGPTRDLQRIVEQINAQPMRDAQEMMRQIRTQPVRDAQKMMRQIRTQPVRDLQETMRQIGTQSTRDLQRIVEQINAQPMRDAQKMMREIGRMPSATLRASLVDLQGVARQIGLEAVEASTAQLADAMEAAESEASEQVETGWLAQLPITSQLGLLVLALGALDGWGAFIADVANVEVPTEVRSATAAVFALTALLIAIVEVRTRPPDEE